MVINKVKAVIIEDEKEDMYLMTNLLKSHQEIEIIATANDIENGIAVVSLHKPDLIFLDINLYGRFSFEIIDAIHELSLNPKIIFTTAYDNYMNKAFKYAAFDYLLKPIDRQELKDTISRYLKNRDKTDLKKSYDKFNEVRKKLIFNTTEGFEIIDPSAIVYLGTVKGQSYTEFFMNNGKVIVITKGIGEVELLLRDAHFFKIHRSYILNLNYLVKINRIRGICHLESIDNKYTVPISKEKIKLLKKQL
jgi:two-component system LytT family response regulator